MYIHRTQSKSLFLPDRYFHTIFVYQGGWRLVGLHLYKRFTLKHIWRNKMLNRQLDMVSLTLSNLIESLDGSLSSMTWRINSFLYVVVTVKRGAICQNDQYHKNWNRANINFSCPFLSALLMVRWSLVGLKQRGITASNVFSFIFHVYILLLVVKNTTALLPLCRFFFFLSGIWEESAN